LTVVAAVDWGGTWLRAGLAVDGSLLVRDRHRRPDGIEEQCDFLCGLVRRLGDELGQPPAALCAGIAGITRRGWVESAANVGIHRPYDLAGRLSRCSDVPVAVVNDVQAAAVAEAASLGPGTAVLLMAGTGIGGAIVHDGRLMPGEGAAGDFGHMVLAPDGPECVCGRRGCLEQLVSGRVLDEVARDLGIVHAGDLDAAARGGHPAAVAALDHAAATLAVALRSITAVTDPAVIVLGGGLMTGGRLLPQLVRKHWRAERPPWSSAEVRPAMLGPDAGLIGAAMLAAGLISPLPGFV
jgi:glucokinase